MKHMSKPYNNTKATLALAKASFRSIMRSPSAVVFTLAFPLIFILVFGFLGGGGIKVDVAVAPGSDLENPVINALEHNSIVHLMTDKDSIEIRTGLQKGNIDAVINVQRNAPGTPAYVANVQYTSASADKGNIFKSVLNNLLYTLNTKDVEPAIAKLQESTIQGRVYRTIDFILPGQLGFSLLSTGVFGTAFVFLPLL
jgi:ABC-2 type transport system permease protein